MTMSEHYLKAAGQLICSVPLQELYLRSEL